MPQPFKTKFKKHLNMSYFMDGGFEQRPILAAAFAEAIEQFAICEGSLGVVYLILNKSRPDEAYAELKLSITFSSRISLIKSCIQQLDQHEQSLILAVVDMGTRAAGMRNKIVHGTWGYSDVLPDAVLLDAVGQGSIDIRERLKGELGQAMNRELSGEGIMVYEPQDFLDVKLAAIDATAPLDILSNYLMADGDEKERCKEMILSDPRTKAKYDKYLQ